MQLLSTIITILLLTISFSLSALSQIIITDDLNRSVPLDRPATRIVSLAPSITETLFALDLHENIVGVTNYCNYPPEALSKSRVGSMVSPDIETIINLQPDLVIISMEGNTREVFDQLDRLGIKLFVSNPRTIDGIYKSMIDIGTLTDSGNRAESVVQAMKRREASVREGETLRPKTLMIVSLQPLLVVGTGTFLAEMLQIAGADNIASETGLTYPAFSKESVVASNPEVIILMSGLTNDRSDIHLLNPEWANVAAVANHRVFVVDADLVSRPGPRVIDGLEALRACLAEGRIRE